VNLAGELEQALAQRRVHGTSGQAMARRIAHGEGWTVSDVVCTCIPGDTSFEEQHKAFSIALVAAGTFQYKAALGLSANRPGTGYELMTPGSVLLGSPGQCYECEHQHGNGDRCISFWYSPEYFERLAADAGARGKLIFSNLRLPPLRELSSLTARACAAISERKAETGTPWEELSVLLAAQVIKLLNEKAGRSAAPPPSTVARVTRAVRMMESRPGDKLSLGKLAAEARLSPYHFLRVFEQLTGLTPHQFLLRARLRQAAARIATEHGRILDIALESGFGDVSNFNRVFRVEFGVNPAQYRTDHRYLRGEMPAV